MLKGVLDKCAGAVTVHAWVLYLGTAGLVLFLAAIQHSHIITLLWHWRQDHTVEHTGRLERQMKQREDTDELKQTIQSRFVQQQHCIMNDWLINKWHIITYVLTVWRRMWSRQWHIKNTIRNVPGEQDTCLLLCFTYPCPFWWLVGQQRFCSLSPSRDEIWCAWLRTGGQAYSYKIPTWQSHLRTATLLDFMIRLPPWDQVGL